MELPDFESYLKWKKIDPKLFREREPAIYEEFQVIFEQIHPDSFTAQKLFLLNKLRRKHKLDAESLPPTTIVQKSIKPKVIVKSPPK